MSSSSHSYTHLFQVNESYGRQNSTWAGKAILNLSDNIGQILLALSAFAADVMEADGPARQQLSHACFAQSNSRRSRVDDLLDLMLNWPG